MPCGLEEVFGSMHGIVGKVEKLGIVIFGKLAINLPVLINIELRNGAEVRCQGPCITK